MTTKIFYRGGEREDAILSFPFKTYFFNKDFFANNEKGEIFAMKNHKYLPKKGMGKVHFRSLALKRRLASFYLH